MAKISFEAEQPANRNTGYALDELSSDTLGATRSSLGGEVSGDLALGADLSDDERRQARRAGVTVRIDYATVDEMFSEFTRDINEGGLFIETEKPHPAGTEVSMQFHLPGSQEVLRTLGRVVRVTSGDIGCPSGMGIEFDELTSDDRVKIDQIVRALRSSGAL